MDHDDGHVRHKPDPADRDRDRDRWGLPPAAAAPKPPGGGGGASPHHLYAHAAGGHSTPRAPPPTQRTHPDAPAGYTLMAAGQRSGKTSFLRLLLDTSTVAPSATDAQLASVARFVAGCAGHTSHIRTAAVDIAPDARGGGSSTGGSNGPERGPVTLTLVDTPSLDFADEDAADRIVSQIIQHVESRFAESLDDEAKAATGDHHVHICLYFLDPDAIVPPSPSGSAPLAPANARARGGSVSQIAPSPLVLEPPVPTNPALCRPVLPAADVAAIRRLSVRVNVLPVVARADTLTNERLAAVKLAVRRDLAEAGIGFGIFDTDIAVPALAQHALDAGEPGHRSPPLAPPALQLPFALISPELYAHSDGVARAQPARHELVQQYAPARSPGALGGPGGGGHPHAPSRLPRGRFTRAFRWGSLDVLDPRHSDFVPLRASVFHHMDTLHKYTREYLFEKFRAELHHAQLARPASTPRRDSTSGGAGPVNGGGGVNGNSNGNGGYTHGLSLSPEQRIIHPDARAHRPSLSVASAAPNGMGLDRDAGLVSAGERDHHRRLSSASSRSHKHQRSKKITVACNFCRSRKLKCDGGRPACNQCVKRTLPCTFTPQIKRRGPGKYKVNGDDSDDDSAADDDENSSDERDERDGGPPDAARDYLELDRERFERLERARRDAEADYAARARYPEHPAPPPAPRSPEVDMRYARAPQPPLGMRPLDVPPPPAGPPSPYQALRERDELAMFGARSRANTSSTTSSAGGPPDLSAHMLPRPSSMTGISNAGAYMGPQLPPIQPLGESRPVSSNGINGDGEPNGRKRAASQSQAGFVKTPRAAPSAGSKVVACNFCRARKTKCDSAHPTCSSCARRNLPCSYVNDPAARGAGTGARKNSNASATASGSASSSAAADAGSGSAPSSAPVTQPPSTSSTTSSASPPPPPSSRPYMLARATHDDPRMEVDDSMMPSAKRLRLDGGYDTGGGGAPPGPMPMVVTS